MPSVSIIQPSVTTVLTATPDSKIQWPFYEVLKPMLFILTRF